MGFDDNRGRDPGPWASAGDGRGVIGGNSHELEREIEEHAAHYAELHPDRPAPIGLAGLVRRMAARLRARPERRHSAQGRPASEDAWAREEALYRAKNKGEPHP